MVTFLKMSPPCATAQSHEEANLAIAARLPSVAGAGAIFRFCRALPGKPVQGLVQLLLFDGVKFSQVEVVNSSSATVGLRVTNSLVPGQPVRLYWPSGQTHDAAVAWWCRGFAELDLTSCGLDDVVHPENVTVEIGSDAHWAEFPHPTDVTADKSYLSSRWQKARDAVHAPRRLLPNLFARLVRSFTKRRIKRRFRRRQAMIDAACRKQGYAWLAE